MIYSTAQRYSTGEKNLGGGKLGPIRLHKLNTSVLFYFVSP